MGEQVVGVGPKLILVGSALRSLRRRFRVWPNDGEVVINHPRFASSYVIRSDLLQHGISLSAVRSLKVRVNFNSNRGIGLPTHWRATLAQGRRRWYDRSWPIEGQAGNNQTGYDENGSHPHSNDPSHLLRLCPPAPFLHGSLPTSLPPSDWPTNWI
jgi:hypothetical protein